MSDSEASNEATSRETPLEQTPVTEIHIFQICGEVGEQWRDLGTVLGIAPTSMDKIERDHSAYRERARKMLLHWINKEEKGTTIGILVNALETIGKKDVVKKLGSSSSDIPFEKTLVTDVQIWSICDEVGVDWRDLGTVLGIASSFMDNIEADNRSSRERARKLLRKWITKEGKGATVGILIDALEEIERIDVIEKLLGTRLVKKRFSCARAQSENSQRKPEKYLKAATKDRVERQLVSDEMHRCLRCPNLEKELNDLKTERVTFKNKISQLEGMRVEDEKEKEKNRKDTKRKDEIIREKITKIADLESTNKIQLEEIEDLKKTKENIKTKKRDLVEEKKKLEKQIGELKAGNEELKLKLQVQIEKQAQKKELRLKLQVQTDLEELNQLKTQNDVLSSQMEELNKKLKSSESECKRLQEELKKYKNYIFLPTGNEFTGNCSGVICFLKRDASAKLHASRSSDGPGEASDILNHGESAISGTAERPNSWWSIDLGLSHRLVITHYSLRQGKRDGESALTDWQLEGSHDGENWEKIKTIYNEEDPQFAAPPPFYTSTWSVEKGIAAFRFFRILQTGGNSSGKYGIYLSGIELFGVLLST